MNITSLILNPVTHRVASQHLLKPHYVIKKVICLKSERLRNLNLYEIHQLSAVSEFIFKKVIFVL